MKKRDKIFIFSTIIIYIFTYTFIVSLIDGAQAVGDAPLNFNPKLKALSISLIIVLCYAIGFYGFYWIKNLFIRKILKNN